MKRSLPAGALLALLLLGAAAPASPPDAVVRLSSHGASGTVIQTAPGRSLILSCAHAFEGRDRARPLVIDAPTAAPAGTSRAVGIRLLAVDERLDLSLIELGDGPLPYCCPVAPAGFTPGGRVLSVGYDAMRYPAVQEWATLLGSTGGTTYTREQPRPGRSGGALLDLDAGCLIGVVQGYETAGPRRGMYVSHQAILSFLGRPATGPPRPAPVLSLPAPPALCPT